MFVTEEGAVKLLDFGIAKSLDNRIGGAATRTGLTPMTPEYASPEQLAGKPLTTACDIYALGLLLYELLSGSLANASKGSSFAELAQRIATQSPTRPSHRVDAVALKIEPRVADDWRRRIAGDLDRVVLKALAAEPQRRYESARVFADDLVRWLENRPVLARGGGVWYRLGKFAQRNRLAVAASTAAVCALAVGLAFAAVQARRAAAEGERALRANRFLTDMIGRADPHFGGKPPTLVDALDRAVIDIPQQLAGQPLLEADIRRAIGHAYLMLERSEAAKVQLDRAADLRAAVGGTDYAKVLDSQGVLEWQLGRHQEAERLFQRGLENTGDDDRGLEQRAELLNDYSSLLSEVGRYDEALAKAEQAQRLKDALPDILPRERAIGLSNIATAQDGLGRVDAAYATYLRSLRQLEAIEPLPELDISITLNNMSFVQQEMGQPDAAVASQERSVALRRKVMGPDFPRLAAPLSNLAQQYAKLGRHDEAAVAMRDALRLAPLAFARDDQMLGHLYTGAANVALARGDGAEAIAQAHNALAVYDRSTTVEPGRREKAQAVLESARAGSDQP